MTNLHRLVQFAPMIALLAYPLFGTYDPSLSNMSYYDFLSMAPNLIWYVISFSLILALSAVYVGKLRFEHLLAVVLLFTVAEVVTNYPMIIARDVYIHGSGVKQILSSGGIVQNQYSPQYNYPRELPSFFLLWSELALVTGGDILQINLLILLPVLVVLLAVSIYCLLKKLFRPLGKVGSVDFAAFGSILAFLLMDFNRDPRTFLHASPRLFAFVLLVVSFLLIYPLYFDTGSRNATQTALLVVGISMISGHVLIPIVAVLFLIITPLFRLGRPYFALAFVFLSWSIFSAYLTFGFGLTSLLAYYQLGYELLITSPSILEPVPAFGVVLRTYYKVLITSLALLSLSSIVIAWKQRTVRFMAALLLSIIVTFGVTLFTASLGASINRGLMIASVVVASLPLTMIVKVENRVTNARFKSIAIIMILLLSFAVVPQFMLVHEPPSVIGLVQPLDHAAEFIYQHRGDERVLSMSSFWIYYRYYDQNSTDTKQLRHIGEVENINTVKSFYIDNAGMKVVDFRDILEWGLRYPAYDTAKQEWQNKVLLPLRSSSNLVYSNGYTIVFVDA